MFSKKIPTFIGLAVLLIGAVIGVVFIGQNTDFLPRAAPEYIPREVKLTNISDSSFSVSWVTRESTIGFIQYGTDQKNLSELAVDERDQLSGSSGLYRTHYITLQGLSPQQVYYYKLGSQGKQLYDNEGEAFSTSTGPIVSNNSNVVTAFGKVFTPAKTPAEGSMVYLMLPNATPLSALVKQNGTWTINMSTARTPDLQGLATFDPDMEAVNLLVRASEDLTSQVSAITKHVRPVSDIILGQVSDLTKVNQDELRDQVAQVSESKFTFQDFEVTEPEGQELISVTTLPKDDIELDSVRPVIQGQAPPGSVLTISVHSNTVYTDAVSVSEDGSWEWTPSGDLSPGDHTLSVNFTDSAGMLHSLTRTFSVSQVSAETGVNLPSYTATPSATITVAPTIAVQPTVSIPKPTATIAPTGVPTLAPTKSLSRVSYPSSSSATLVAGVVTPTALSVLFGAGFLLMGLYLHKSTFTRY